MGQEDGPAPMAGKKIFLLCHIYIYNIKLFCAAEHCTVSSHCSCLLIHTVKCTFLTMDLFLKTTTVSGGYILHLFDNNVMRKGY
jgi:hypothetical protein